MGAPYMYDISRPRVNRLTEKKGIKYTHNFYFAYYQFSLQVILGISTLRILPYLFPSCTLVASYFSNHLFLG